MTPPTPRRMWQLLETVHAVVYFAPEVTQAYKGVGLKGFWMGYFAGRAAPLGPATPELVTATFFNFHPSMVSRALPDAWSLASPADVLAARNEAVGEVLGRLLADVPADDVAAAADLAAAAVEGCSLAGRPLFAAYRSLPWPDEPVLRLWHAATLLREHRGDGHVAANVAAGFDGLAAHIAMCATGAVPRDGIQPHRGWSDEDWDAAVLRLADAGVVTPGGERLTDHGRALRAQVEDATDELAAEPWQHLGAEHAEQLHGLLQPMTAAVLASGLIPFPNPMGLPHPSSALV